MAAWDDIRRLFHVEPAYDGLPYRGQESAGSDPDDGMWVDLPDGTRRWQRAHTHGGYRGAAAADRDRSVHACHCQWSKHGRLLKANPDCPNEIHARWAHGEDY